MSKIQTQIFNQNNSRLVDDYANMDDFLDDLIPEIRHWSEDLDEHEYYTGDFPWREITDNEDFDDSILYFFKEESEFLYSINGNVQHGHWRTLESNKMLLERNALVHSDKELYDLLFMNDEFMILQKPGDQPALGKSKYLVLVREHKVHSTDWKSAMTQLADDHKKGIGTIIIGTIVMALLFIIFYLWR
jgi:hypothetical protein